jgi:hypothetical protein
VLFSWSTQRIVGITGDTVNPDKQDQYAQAGSDAWIMEMRDYLKDNIIPDEHVSAERIIHVAKRNTLVEGDLYWRGTNGIVMRCKTREDGCELLVEIHRGKCSNHASYRTLVGKDFQHVIYWPTTRKDTIELVKRCKACQFHAKCIHTPKQMLQMMPLS